VIILKFIRLNHHQITHVGFIEKFLVMILENYCNRSKWDLHSGETWMLIHGMSIYLKYSPFNLEMEMCIIGTPEMEVSRGSTRVPLGLAWIATGIL